ncbi:MAG: ABC transporter ATP-binding protein [Actinomycetota bacterium]
MASSDVSAPTLSEVVARRRLWLGVSAVTAIGGALVGLVPYVVVYLIAVDLFDDGGPDRERTLFLATIAGIAVISQIALNTLANYVSHVAAYRVLSDLRLALADRLARMPLGRVKERSSGHLKNVLQDDVEQMELGLSHAIPDVASAVAVPVASLAVMFWIDWRMGLGALAVIVLSMIILSGAAARAAGYAPIESAAKSDLTTSVVSYLRGMPVVRGFVRGGQAYDQADRAIAEVERIELLKMSRGRVFVAAASALIGTSTVILLPLGLFLVDRGSLSTAEFVFFILIGVAFAQPLVNMTLTLAVLQYQIEAGAKNIGRILAEPDLPRATATERPTGFRLEIDDVGFRYPNPPGASEEAGDGGSASDADDDQTPSTRRPSVLTGVSLDIPEGTSIALVGASGAGKSTMLRLLARFYDVTEGSIRLGGVDLRAMDPTDLMRRIAFVQQDDFLFNDTVLENIRLARPSATDEEVIEAARSARVVDFIDLLDDGWQTVLGPDGTQLSGGQQQRISAARAFLKQSDVILLDEATSFLDPESEEAVGLALAELRRSRTVVTVAHRLGSVADYDTIVVLEDGRIEAMGRHAELLESSPRYRDMWAAYKEAQGWRLTSDAGPAEVTVIPDAATAPAVVSPADGNGDGTTGDASVSVTPVVDDLGERNLFGQWLALLGRKRPTLWRRGLWRIMVEGMLVSAPLPVIYFALLAVLDDDRDPASPLVYGAVLVAIVIGRWAAGLTVATVWWPVAMRAISDLQRSVLAQLRRIPLGVFDRMSVGRLTTLVGSDLPLIDFINIPSRLIVAATQPLIAAVFLLVLDWPLALAALAGLPLFLLLLWWSDRVERSVLIELLERRQRAATDLLEFVEGTAVIRAYPDAPQASRYQRAVEELRRASVRASIRVSPVVALGRAVLEVGFAAILAVGALRVLSDDLSASAYLLTMIFAFNLYRPYQELIALSGYRHLQSRVASQVAEVWEAPVLPPGSSSATPRVGVVEFDEVDFSYADDGDAETLRNISFRAEPGTVTALVGPSGAGKSTIANLVARFWDVDGGAIRIDGHDVRSLPSTELLAAVTTVYQDVFLFPDTVRANLTLGAPEATDDDIRRVLRAAQAWDVVQALPDGLDTVIGDGGAQLSGGEAQRLSIARALLKDSPILLLDEAVASVDPETEVRIQAALSSLVAGRTVLVIAHRLNTIANADQIVVLDSGRLDGAGSHADLLVDSPTYARLWAAHERASRLRGAAASASPSASGVGTGTPGGS